MSDSVTIKLAATGSYMKRWHTLRYNPHGKNPDAIVIRVNKKEGSVTHTIYPYEEVDCGRLGRIVWFFCLKICVYLKII